jgi:hypothetical protein
MRAVVLSLVLGLATLGTLVATPSQATARDWHGRNWQSYYAGPRYWYGGTHWRGGSHWRGASRYVYPGYGYYYPGFTSVYSYSPGYYYPSYYPTYRYRSYYYYSPAFFWP